MHDFRCEKAEKMYLKELAKETRVLKETEGGIAKMNEYLNEEEQKLYEQGRLQGILQIAIRMLDKGKSIEEIKELTGLAYDEIATSK